MGITLDNSFSLPGSPRKYDNTAAHFWSFDKFDSVFRIHDELGINTLAKVNGKVSPREI